MLFSSSIDIEKQEEDGTRREEAELVETVELKRVGQVHAKKESQRETQKAREGEVTGIGVGDGIGGWGAGAEPTREHQPLIEAFKMGAKEPVSEPIPTPVRNPFLNAAGNDVHDFHTWKTLADFGYEFKGTIYTLIYYGLSFSSPPAFQSRKFDQNWK